jgi:thiol-disulfide isomerase/thioredoxin
VKGRYYILAISLLVAILAVIVLYEHENPENPPLTTESSRTRETDQLFGEMGITPVNPGAGPFDIALQSLDGGTVNLEKYRGKIVFLNFWTTWCQSCRDELPSMGKLYDKLRNRDFAMVALDLEQPASMVKEFVQEFKLPFTVLLDSDGKAKSLFGAGTIPTTFILDKEGKVIGTAVGPREWDSKKSIALFERLIAEKAAPAS